jgi:enoyl-CoA hydratase/carnithine racemase
MDARLAATNARFDFVFARRGITPEACSSWFLPRLVGVPTALEWLHSGRVFDAHEALDKGLVQALHERGTLVDAAIA